MLFLSHGLVVGMCMFADVENCLLKESRGIDVLQNNCLLSSLSLSLSLSRNLNINVIEDLHKGGSAKNMSIDL